VRPIKVLLVDQSDLGQGTSGRYHGLLHSGGRYVISDPVSARDCAHENEILRRLAPSTIEDTGGLFVSAPADPPEFPDRWLAACRETGVSAEEISISDTVQSEPLLNPELTRLRPRGSLT
jgi:glycerol-3-phosphate dehydrogenase